MYFITDQDGAEPSGNSVGCQNLIRIACYLGRHELYDKASQLLKFMRQMLSQLPVACPELVSALVNLIDSNTQVFIL